MAHVWIVEVRDVNTTKPGGWTEWHALYARTYPVAYGTRREAVYAAHDHADHAVPGEQYRVRRYDRLEG